MTYVVFSCFAPEVNKNEMQDFLIWELLVLFFMDCGSLVILKSKNINEPPGFYNKSSI